MKKKRAKVEKTSTCQAYVAMSGRAILPGTVRSTAKEVWNDYMIVNQTLYLSRKEVRECFGVSVVPCTITYPTPKRKAKR